MSYAWRKGADWGGGYQSDVLPDPTTSGRAFAMGDLWGDYYTTDAGSSWIGAMNGWNVSTSGVTGNPGRSCAWSAKTPGKIYVGHGSPASNKGGFGNGYFGWVQNGISTQSSNSTYGFGSNLPGRPNGSRPRSNGRLIQVDFDGASTEYVYALVSNSAGLVLVRTTDGNTFTSLGTFPGNAWKSSLLFTSSGGSFPDTLLIGTYRNTANDGSSPGGCVISKITAGSATIRAATGSGALTTTTVGAAPGVVEKMIQVGSNYYAACGPSGVYQITSNGGTWTKISGTFFNNSWVSAVDGSGSTLYACCAGAGGKATGANIVAKSTDSGSTWNWVTSSTVTHGTTGVTNSVPWGTTSEWWLLATGAPNFSNYLGGSTMDAQELCVDRDGNIYVCGNAGSWISKDGGAHWRPSVIGLNGGEVTLITVGAGGSASANNFDYTRCDTTNHFATGSRSGTALSGTVNGGLTATSGPDTYTITTGTPAGIKKNGTSIDDAFFRSTVVDFVDFKVSTDGFVYLAMDGGGVIVGDPNGGVVVDNPPTAATLTATATGSASIRLSWTGATDDIGISGYEVTRVGTGIIAANTPGPTFDVSGLTASTSYSFTVKTIDTASPPQKSPASNTASATTLPGGDITPPTPPTTVTATALSSTSIRINWSGAADNVGVTGYELSRGGAVLTTLGNVLTYTDPGLTPSTNYSYTVKATDAAGNKSIASSSASATTLGNRTLIGTTSGGVITFTDPNCLPSTTYTYVVTASDAAGNPSAESNQASATTPFGVDVIPPTPPGSFTAAVSGANIALSWTAAVDNVGVTQYKVYRSGVVIATLGVATSYTDTSGVPGTSYTYQATALDGAHNESSLSNAVTITYPSAPSGTVTVRAQGQATAVAATSISFSPPAGSQVGDIIYGALHITANTPIVQTGWNGGVSVSVGGNIKVATAWKAYQASDTTYTWSWSGAANAVVEVYTITGTDTVTVIDARNISGLDSGTPPPIGAITLPTGGDLLMLDAAAAGTNSFTGDLGATWTTTRTPRSPVANLTRVAGNLVGAASGTQGPWSTTLTLAVGIIGTVTAFKAGTPPPPVNNPPTVTVTSPTNGQTVNSASINVQATASDTDGIADVSVNVNNTGFQSMTPTAVDGAGNGSYSLTVALNTDVSPGAVNTIDVRATDANPSSPASKAAPEVSIFAVVDAADTTGPTVAWGNPPSGGDLTIQGDDGLLFTIAGVTTDASGIASIIVTNPDASTGAANPDASGNFSYFWALATGDNAFTFVFTDASPAANTTSKSFTLTLQAPDAIDVTGPSLTVTAPAQNQTVSGPSGTLYNATGVTSDPSGIASVTVNGVAVAVDDQGAFSTLIPLALGTNVFTAVSTDASANSNTTTAEWTVTLVSTQGPTLAVTTPATDTFITGADPYLFELIGSVSSANGISALTVNSLPVPFAADGSWAQIVSLSQGENVFTVTATDAQVVPQTTLITRTITLTPPSTQPGDAFNLSTDQERIAERLQERGVE